MEKRKKIDAIKGLVRITKPRDAGQPDGNLEQAPHITAYNGKLYTDSKRRWWSGKDMTKDK